MKAASCQIANFQRRILPKALLHRTIPLLDVLRGRMWVERREAHRRRWQRALTQYWSTEVESTRKQGCGRREVIRLLCFRKDIRHVVSLVAPGILVDRCNEDT